MKKTIAAAIITLSLVTTPAMAANVGEIIAGMVSGAAAGGMTGLAMDNREEIARIRAEAELERERIRQRAINRRAGVTYTSSSRRHECTHDCVFFNGYMISHYDLWRIRHGR